MAKVFTTDAEFEAEVIRTARFLWPNAGISGKVILGDRERDGVFITDDTVHIVECTTSRTKQKAVDDFKKSVRLARDLKSKYKDFAFQCWFITADEPTADQMAVASQNSQNGIFTRAMAFDSFRSRLINAADYLAARSEYAFGSARNLADNSANLPKNAYIPLDLLRVSDSASWSVTTLTNKIISAQVQRIVIFGDYGAGKSMTLREIYLGLVAAYRKGRTTRFPVFLNLRDHSGQSLPVEALERHARQVGFSRPEQLVRAWNAGYITLILDGFDELSSTGWMMFNRLLRRVRYDSVELVRRFVSDSPVGNCVLIAGRESYFDNTDECLSAIGFNGQEHDIFSLNDFTEGQIQEFARRNRSEALIPEWMPSRPLLVGYLLLRGALNDQVLHSSEDIGSGWDYLIDAVCRREATTHTSIDSSSVRRILENLGTIARGKGGCMAALDTNDLATAFRQAVGTQPDERAETLLMRLPGLGPSSLGDGTRAFLDRDFANACVAGGVRDFVSSPFHSDFRAVAAAQEVVSNTGALVAYELLDKAGILNQKIFVALNQAIELGNGHALKSELSVDILKIIIYAEIGSPNSQLSGMIQGAFIDELDLSNVIVDLSRVEFRDCIIGSLTVSSVSDKDFLLPKFTGVTIEYVEGRSGHTDLPEEKFPECDIYEFGDSIATNAAALDSTSILPGVRILVTVLRKLFIQKGGGRKENAFFRGIPVNQTDLVREVLDLIERTDYARRSRRRLGDPVWTPNPRMRARVTGILMAPHLSQEGIVEAVKKKT